jgi:hypothetical protein
MMQYTEMLLEEEIINYRYSLADKYWLYSVQFPDFPMPSLQNQIPAATNST